MPLFQYVAYMQTNQKAVRYIADVKHSAFLQLRLQLNFYY